MENPKFNPAVESDEYKLIGEKFSRWREMGDWEKNCVFEVAIKHASGLVDQNADEISGLFQKSEDVRKHLDIIVLDRINSYYQAGSTVMFENLKKEICDSFSINEKVLPDESLHSFLSFSLDKYFEDEIDNEVKNNMVFIRAAVERVVPSKG